MATALTKEEAFARLGSITRELHEALNILGENQLHAIVEEIPGARERLTHVGKLTEDAANKVLSLVEEAKPRCDALESHGHALGRELVQVANDSGLCIERSKEMLAKCHDYAIEAAVFSQKQSEVLCDIMMAQDFQDLSGQVIKKVINVINRTELQLVGLLIDSSPNAVNLGAESTSLPEPATHKLEGPQTPTTALAQGDVDDLLASLGF